MKWFGSKIKVTFVDEATGAAFATSKMQPGDLPQSFKRRTTMHLCGDDWEVVKASPRTRAEYAKSRRLTLRLSRRLNVDPQAILYSLPTICDAIPGFSGVPVDGTEWVLSEDDWRQVELVSKDLMGQVDDELLEIRAILGRATDPGGWSEMHVRCKPRSPLVCELKLEDLLRESFVERVLGGVAYRDSKTRIEGGFALDLGGWILYGVTQGTLVQSLGLMPSQRTGDVAPIKALAQRHGLELVLWCAGTRVSPGQASFGALLAECAI